MSKLGWCVLGAAGALLAFASAAVQAADNPPPPLYVLKQDIASTGSHIRRKAVWGSDVPMNRRYSELTPEQQELVKSRYEAMRLLDEPPYPVDGLRLVYEAVRDVQSRLGETGDVSIFVDIDPNGDAVSASIMKSPDERLTNALASVLMAIKYKPAVCRGKPCAMGYPFRMSFSVER